MEGKLIILEGLDGCGKSTQLMLLGEKFPGARFLTFPNYDAPSGAMITEYLKTGYGEQDPAASAYSASMLYAADRYVSYRKDWAAAYQAGQTMISARYTTSNAIYQMTKLPRPAWDDYLAWIRDLEYGKLRLPEPDLVLFLDVPVEVSQALLSVRYGGDEGKKDLHEADTDYLRACRDAAVYASAASPRPWQWIDCTAQGRMRSPGEIHKELAACIAEVLQA